jgi:predicted RNase H-like HicB family nuclease
MIITNKSEIMNKIPVPVVITKEKLGKKDIFVALCPLVDVASQGKTSEEAIKNLKDALNLYWQEPESKKIARYEEVFAGTIEVSVSRRILNEAAGCVRT